MNEFQYQLIFGHLELGAQAVTALVTVLRLINFTSELVRPSQA